jgi:hypothetical protein
MRLRERTALHAGRHDNAVARAAPEKPARCQGAFDLQVGVQPGNATPRSKVYKT